MWQLESALPHSCFICRDLSHAFFALGCRSWFHPLECQKVTVVYSVVVLAHVCGASYFLRTQEKHTSTGLVTSSTTSQSGILGFRVRLNW